MADKVRNPFLCATAEFGPEEPGSRVFKLNACGAWANLDLVDLRQFGLEHRATWVRLDSNDQATEPAAERIGESCTRLCIECTRFKPKTQSQLVSASSYPSDPEYYPGPDTDVGFSATEPSVLLHRPGV